MYFAYKANLYSSSSSSELDSDSDPDTSDFASETDNRHRRVKRRTAEEWEAFAREKRERMKERKLEYVEARLIKKAIKESRRAEKVTVELKR